MEDGLSTLLKYVGSLKRLFKLHGTQNCSKNELEISVFKSPKTIKLSYFEEQKSLPLLIRCKSSAIKFEFGLYKHDMSHFLDFKLISPKTFSISFSDVNSFKILHGMSSRT